MVQLYNTCSLDAGDASMMMAAWRVEQSGTGLAQLLGILFPQSLLTMHCT